MYTTMACDGPTVAGPLVFIDDDDGNISRGAKASVVAMKRKMNSSIPTVDLNEIDRIINSLYCSWSLPR